MPLGIKKLWHRLFLEERSSIGISFFRIFVALTVGLHVIPSFFHLEDNFLSASFREINLSFFTSDVVLWIQKSPDTVVYFFVAFFCVSWFMFLVGLFSQVSCILMTLCCYYFYALNCCHIGTLSWDILLVTLFLMCVTGYHSDYFSLDVLRGHDLFAYRKKRPFFIQRLLQMQIASTYFYTALYKIFGSGNWLRDNPVYYLMNYPPEGVTKQFIFRDFFAVHPGLCYAVGVAIVTVEMLMPFLLFMQRTRIFAIGIGFFFHILLVITLHVPTIFFFLFPAQLLLFINPEDIVKWIERKRARCEQEGQAQIIYDGRCRFCLASIEKLNIMDLFGYLKKIDFHAVTDVKTLHPKLTHELCHSQLHLIEPDGTLLGGFFIFRRLCFKIPMLFVLMPILYFPGSGIIGPPLYRWVAKNRYLFHLSRVCKDNACFRR